MKIPKYWARAVYPDHKSEELETAYAWGWSFESEEEALAVASERAKRLGELLNSDNGYEKLFKLRRGQEYDYAEVPLREEILDTYGDDATGDEIALVTRNRYGSIVLNVDSVCFVDIDFVQTPVTPAGFWGGVKALFTPPPPKVAGQSDETRAIESVLKWAEANIERSFRLYRTAAGLRLLFTDRRYDPLSVEVNQFFQELGSDPLYRALTRKQECFRARLTPKPWRCGVHEARCGNTFVVPDPVGKIELRQWVEQYDKACAGFGVCDLMQIFGDESTDPVIMRVIEIHDKYTLKDKSLPLA